MIRRILLWLSGHSCAAHASIPFARAVLCLDCDHVSASRGNVCDRCKSSGALMPLWSAQLPAAPLAKHALVIPFGARKGLPR